MTAKGLRVLIYGLPVSSRAAHLSCPKKNRVQAEQSHQQENDYAPFTDPKRVPFIEGKQNIRRVFMDPHVKENVGYTSNETRSVNRLEGISHFFGEKPEKPVDPEDGFVEPSLHYIND